MKKKVALMLALIMAMSLALVGCGGGSSEKDIAGVYKIVEMENNGEDATDQITTLAEYGIELAYLVLEDGGEGYLVMMGDKQDLEWDKKSITIDGDAADFTFKSDKLTLEEEGTKMVFKKLSKKEMDAFNEAEENGFELDMDKLLEAYSSMEE